MDRPRRAAARRRRRCRPAPALQPTVRGLANAIATLQGAGRRALRAPYRLDDAGWVANRWCEILPISLAAKQKLMELDDPRVRLQLVDEFLRGKGVVVSLLAPASSLRTGAGRPSAAPRRA